MEKLKGKNAIVTGGAMGIGLATAHRLVNEGCNVTIWDFNKEALAKASEELKALKKADVYSQLCDVADKSEVKALAMKAEQEMGCVDFLINNAGIERHGRFTEKPLEDWEKVNAVNLNAVYFTTYAILPGMLRRNYGHIVNISSGAGIVGAADLAAYCASKWAVWGFTESLRMESKMDRKNVRFSSIHPFFLKEGIFKGSQINFLGEFLIPRISTHDKVAKAIVDKALKKGRNTVKIPVTLHLAIILRAFLPDFIFNFVIGRLLGVGRGMKNWVGQEVQEVR
ncbi:KR domain protein [Leptospira fainei serovar Hurstbridge str. BUT 6]|uniref:KR domain protein n=1 Tax=Leptospira fainei serovar Hurstbridge str. BUT 6 TaxID=1193011 RepID=S3V461_9LEPT|nr:SDR family NAD(P)-dependent oxidoreductase [Leptospira fainei]EPG75419.1 KR domain protein [Leptospira fainei serovar Hurstbridge str. BUT 6]